MNTPTPLAELPDLALLRRYECNGPRYTSYPTALQFAPGIGEADYRRAVIAANAAAPDAPLSVYLHVPFCSSPCFYCGCNRVISRQPERGERYLQRLLLEIGRHAALFGGRRPIEQLHLGGGTPTFFDTAQIGRLLAALEAGFGFASPETREFSIEVDPRSVTPGDVQMLGLLGFNRLSLGIQDFDPEVQRAVNRVQGVEQVAAIVEAARGAGFRSIAFDLIHGLPKQNPASFARTLDAVLALAPDRIATYSYAHLPARFPAQRQIRDEDLPTLPERLELATGTARRLIGAGYVHIGMDHYARPDDSLAQALADGTLQRNFQGYSTRAALDLVPVGVSAIGRIGDAYFQNARELATWEPAIDAGHLAIERGVRLSAEDRLRAEVIGRLMCEGRLDYAAIDARHGIAFEQHFADALAKLAAPLADGLVVAGDRSLQVTPLGRHLLRAVAMPFDAYLKPAPAAGAPRAAYSRVI